MTWANDPYPYTDARLMTHFNGRFIKFWDRDLAESVTVFAPPEFEDVTMTVNIEGRTVTLTMDDATHLVKGQNSASRSVWHYVTREHATALRAGLTVHKPYSIISSTPHEFELQPEPGFEEVFYFILPDGGKGTLEGEGMWPDGQRVDAAWPVRDGQLAQVPMGWHRVVALPGEDGVPPRLGYVWAYLALHDRWEK